MRCRSGRCKSTRAQETTIDVVRRKNMTEEIFAFNDTEMASLVYLWLML
jgi:hypothetical protein